jgi:aspartyl-tRNA(Asn)/glutamyl-tRNA(Gln) amidotransferase subunit C
VKISESDVEYVAKLAMLEVADEEKKALAEQLSRIVEYVEKLNELDLRPASSTPFETIVWSRGRAVPRPDAP